jgi:hypothetical protein
LNDQLDIDDLLRNYALGRLGEQQLEAVERKIFSDREFFTRLRIVEADLIDAYTAGSLSKEERLRFEKYLLRSREDRERVEFSRALSLTATRRARMLKPGALARFLSAATEFTRNRLIIIPLAASLLLAVLCVWLVFETSRLSNQLEAIRSEKTGGETRARELEQQLAAEKEQNVKLLEDLARERETHAAARPVPPATGIAAFVLMLGGVRDQSASPQIIVPPEAAQVRLDAVLQTSDYARYRAELQTVGGQVLWQGAAPTRRRGKGRLATVTLPARTLGEGDYILAVTGVTASGDEETVGEYFFRVRSRR